MIGLDQRATVYGKGATGRYDQVVRTDLPCRLAHIGPQGDGNQRAELAALRRLQWDPSYDMPAGSQIVVDGNRWQVVRGTEAALRGPAGKVSVRAADAVKQV